MLTLISPRKATQMQFIVFILLSCWVTNGQGFTSKVMFSDPTHLFCYHLSEPFFNQSFLSNEIVFESDAWITNDNSNLRLAKASSNHGPDDVELQRQFVFDFISESDNEGIWQDLNQTFKEHYTYEFAVALGIAPDYTPYSSYVTLSFRDEANNVLALRTIVANTLPTAGYDIRTVVLDVPDGAEYLGQTLRVAVEFAGSGISAAVAGFQVCVLDAPTTTTTTSTSSTSSTTTTSSTSSTSSTSTTSSTSSTSSTSTTTSTSSTSSTTQAPCEQASDYSFEQQYTTTEKLFDNSTGWTLRAGTDARLLRMPSPLGPKTGITGDQFLIVGASDDDRPGLYQTLTRTYMAGQNLRLFVDMGQSEFMEYANFVSLEFLDADLEPRAVRTVAAASVSKDVYTTYSLEFEVPCDFYLQDEPMRIGIMFSGSSLSVALDNIRVCVLDWAKDTCEPTSTTTTSTSSTSSITSTTSTTSTSPTPETLDDWVCDSAAASSALSQAWARKPPTASTFKRVVVTDDCEIFEIPHDVTAIQGLLHINAASPLTKTSYDLSQLVSVGSDITIINASGLSGAGAFSSLESVGGAIRIQELRDVQALSHVFQMSSLTQIHGLTISMNEQLVEASGLSSLTSINGDLVITGNANLQTASGLAGLQNINGSLTIMGNPEWCPYSNLANVEHIEGDLVVSGVPSDCLATDWRPVVNGSCIGSEDVESVCSAAVVSTQCTTVIGNTYESCLDTCSFQGLFCNEEAIVAINTSSAVQDVASEHGHSCLDVVPAPVPSLTLVWDQLTCHYADETVEAPCAESWPNTRMVCICCDAI
eukprot:TRINITY_DN12383_c1_g2_i13.p1 TRINITY_DN12383_c1_g2~~TRINITY_DN12383_c1_g2_i13.p1  ORF type:complete len:815 (+),score=154.31 TRINITY_DN12383_c1_g2_i13:43-2487(+)